MQGWLDDQGAGQIGANGLYFGLQSESDSVATRAESRARTMTASIMAWSDQSDESKRGAVCSYSLREHCGK
jgi:hypothetical protein